MDELVAHGVCKELSSALKLGWSIRVLDFRQIENSFEVYFISPGKLLVLAVVVQGRLYHTL